MDSASWLVDRSLNAVFLNAERSAPKLRVGILIDGDSAPAFARSVMEDIRACDYAEIVCFISDSSVRTKVPATRSLVVRVIRAILRGSSWPTLFYLGYLRWIDARRRARLEPDPERCVNCADLMAGAALIEVQPLRTGAVDRFSAVDVERIVALQLDVILRFGFRILRGDILTAAQHGIWSFHHGDCDRYRGGPPYAWELIEQNPVSGAVLQVLGNDLDGGRILADAWFATTSFLSVSENGFAPFWGTQHFVIRCLHALHTLGANAFSASIRAARPYAGRRKIYRVPSNADVARWLVPQIGRRVARRIDRHPVRVHWRVGIRRTALPLHTDPSESALRQFHWLNSPPGHFWADPFLIKRDDAVWLFYEDFDYQTGKGVLACGRVGPSGDLAETRVILARPYHLSYPHVFASNGEVFMIPESAAAGTVDLYRARRFPDDWVHERVLLKLRAVDSTVFTRDGRWWMLSSPMTVAGHAPFTYLWTAPALVGPWRLSAHTPLSSDVRGARCGGRVFTRGTELWRPSQDCSGRYGRALVFSRIHQLTGTPRESRELVIEPGWLAPIVGTHSYNFEGDWEVIDGQFLERA